MTASNLSRRIAQKCTNLTRCMLPYVSVADGVFLFANIAIYWLKFWWASVVKLKYIRNGFHIYSTELYVASGNKWLMTKNNVLSSQLAAQLILYCYVKFLYRFSPFLLKCSWCHLALGWRYSLLVANFACYFVSLFVYFPGFPVAYWFAPRRCVCVRQWEVYFLT